jgi:hypothetical protein
MGFFTQINNCVRSYCRKITGAPAIAIGMHCTKSGMIGALWKVYSVLMEYSYQNRYKMQINQIVEDAKATSEFK